MDDKGDQASGNQTVEKLYGIPFDQDVYICRLCCLSYDSKELFEEHAVTHNWPQSCLYCSAIAMSEDEMRIHWAQHMPETESDHLRYVCPICKTTYSASERLYFHLSYSHAQPLLYFCKNCGLGNTDGFAVYRHIRKKQCNWQVDIYGCAFMGFTAASIFHHYPKDPAKYNKTVENEVFLVVTPPKCTHCSFLFQPFDSVLVSCPDCHSLVTVKEFFGDKPQLMEKWLSFLNCAADDNNIKILNLIFIWEWMNIRAEQSVSTEKRSREPNYWQIIAQSTMVDPDVFQEAASHDIQVRRTNCISSQDPVSQMESLLIWDPIENDIKINPDIPFLPPLHTTFFRGALEAISQKLSLTSVTIQNYVTGINRKFSCTIPNCHLTTNDLKTRRLHNLQHNDQFSFICLECDKAFSSEIIVVKHMIEIHYQKNVPQMYLRCPLCLKKPKFELSLTYKMHLGMHFERDYGYPFAFKKRCRLLFYSPEARSRHEEEHRATIDRECCFICGTSRDWWFKKETPDFPYIDHSYIHAFALYGICRGCGAGYADEPQNQHFLIHFIKHHMNIMNGITYCEVCNTGEEISNIEEHALLGHFVVGLKTQRRRSFTVRVNEPILRAFLGVQE